MLAMTSQLMKHLKLILNSQVLVLIHENNLKRLQRNLTLKNAHQKDGRFLKPEDKSIMKNKSILCESGKIISIDSFSSIEKIIQMQLSLTAVTFVLRLNL